MQGGVEEKRLACERAHIVLGRLPEKKKRIVIIIIIIIAAHTREPLEIGGGGASSPLSPMSG